MPDPGWRSGRPRRARRPGRRCRSPAGGASRCSPGRPPRAAAPAAGAGSRVRCRRAPPTVRPVWPRRSRPSPGTWSWPTPTVIRRPTFSSTSRRSRIAISVGVPDTRPSPPTSRNASSMDTPSTCGVVSRNTSKTSLLAWRVRGHARLHHDGVGAQPAGPGAAHGAADALAPWPRSWPRAPRPIPRSPAGRAAVGRRVARPRQRRRRGRRAGSMPTLTARTYVRINAGEMRDPAPRPSCLTNQDQPCAPR